MAKIILTYGPPGCGKTTWATNYVKNTKRKTVIVNLDDLRSTMFGDIHNYKFSKENELYVKTAQQNQVLDLISKGSDVIISNTNLNPNELNYWIEFSKSNNCNIDCIDFFEEYIKEQLKIELHNVAKGKPSTLAKVDSNYFLLNKFRNLCKERNMSRYKSVPESVIDKMIDDYILPNYMIKQHTYDPNLPNCIVSDVDGTLMHRLPMKNGKIRSPYDETLVLYDTPDSAVVESLKFESTKYPIFIFSARHETCKDDTLKSITETGLEIKDIFMRKENDNRSDDIIKYELYLEHIHGKYNIIRWYDDRDRVVKLLRHMNVKVYQTANGNF